MTKKTAAKVADVLGLVEAYLEGGRPRKRPGKSRPEAIHLLGLPTRVTKKNFWDIEKVSLVGAIKMACLDQGYSKTVRQAAITAFIIASDNDHLAYYQRGYLDKAIQLIDDEAWDTRWLQRDARRARKTIEKEYAL